VPAIRLSATQAPCRSLLLRYSHSSVRWCDSAPLQ
jgi:hypothetical protein